MKNIVKVLRLAGSVVGLLLAVVVALYLIILAVNWRDRPVGAAAARLEQISRNNPVIAEADNAYIHFVGLGAVSEGRASSRGFPSDRLSWLSNECREFSLPCYDALSSNEELIGAWLKDDQWLLEHYRALLERRSWHAAGPRGQTASVGPISAAQDGQRMLMHLAWTRAAAGDAAGVRQLLEQDIRFWRMVLASSGDLITKTFAGWAFHGHFKWANMVLRKLPADRQLQAVPQQWRMPVTLEERSLLRPIAGEQYRVLRQFNVFEPGYRTSDTFESIAVKLAAPTAQRQDYLNRYSALVAAVSDTLDVPHESFPAALRQAKGLVQKARNDAFDGWAYNLMGNLTMRFAPPDIVDYGVSAADLEGTRRAALLTVELRAEGVDTDRIAAKLASASLRNPYDKLPFAWDAKARSVVFTGLEGGLRHHAILY